MLDLEIVAVKCLDCEQMVWSGDDHPCWLEELGMRALEEAMWKKYQAEVAIEPAPEQVAEKDCPLCPEWAEEKFKIGYDDFGGICQIDGVACCDTCYRVYHLTHPYEESNE